MSRLILLLILTLTLKSEQLAFPTAEGFGQYSKGGRGGKVYFVTKLLDNRSDIPMIKGSLREAVEAEGPRTVIFKVSGTIHLQRPLIITNPFITIAGQSAPGDGICLSQHEVQIRTNDVIIRHLRIRPGDTLGKIFKKHGKSWSADALNITKGSKNVIVDHCSMSWGNDEVCSVSGEGITNVTVQWSFITESLNDSTHEKGPHGYGSLIRTNGNISFHHNLYAYHRSRSPRPGTYGEGSILFDFRNNFMFKGGQGYTSKDPVRMNFIANWHENTPFKAREACQFFAQGNKGIFSGGRQLKREFKVATVKTSSAEQAKKDILKFSGATLPVRDKIDQRIVDQISKNKGSIINSQNDVGGYCLLTKGTALKDSDNDGMPDNWELKFKLDVQKESNNIDTDSDGYTDLEEFLNNTDPTQKEEK